MNDHMNPKLEQLATPLLPEGIFPAAKAASRWLIFKSLFPHHFKTLSWESIKLLYFQVCLSAHLHPSAGQVGLTYHSGCSLFLLKNLIFLKGG